MNEYLTCPKCKRYDAMEHRGNGFYYCLWMDCLNMINISNYKEPKINLNRYKEFRNTIKAKTTIS